MSKLTIPLATVLLGAALGSAALASPTPAPTAAAATPVPLPEQGPQLPPGDALQSQLSHLQAFQSQADHHIRTLHAATEHYREYVGHVRETLATCQVQADLEGGEQHPFARLLAGDDAQCQAQIVAFKEQARIYAVELDTAMAFGTLVQEAAESAQRQVDRIRLMQHARRLKQQVDTGLETLEQAKDSLRPWMN